MKCKCSLNNQYKIIGLCDIKNFNEKISKFMDQSYSQLSLPEQINLPDNFPNLECILKVYLDIEINSTKFINTPVSNSINIEGLKLTGKMLLINGILNQTIIYTSDSDTDKKNKTKYSLKCNTPFSSYIVLDQQSDKINDIYCIYPYIENISLIPLNKRTINKSINLFLFAHNMKSKPVLPPVSIEKLPNSFVFMSFDTNKKMSTIEFDKINKQLIVSSTGITYNSKFTNAFIFELKDSSQTRLKAVGFIKGEGNADEFKTKLNNIGFEYGDLINLNFANKSKVILTDYPNKNDIYNMQTFSNQGFQITPTGIVPYILPNDIILNSENNTPVVTIQFDILNNLMLVNSTGNTTNPNGGINYFKMTLYEPDGTSEKLTSHISGNSNANDFQGDFFNENFEYGDIIKLQYEENSKVIITNFHSLSTKYYNPTGNEESFKITENGLEKFVPIVEKLQNKITVKSKNNNEVLTIEFNKTSKKFIVQSTGEIPDASSKDIYFTAILKDDFASDTFEVVLNSNENADAFKSRLNNIDFIAGYNKLALIYKNKDSIQISNYPNLGKTYIPNFDSCIFDITLNGLVDSTFENKITLANDNNEEMATIQFTKTPGHPRILVTSTNAISTNRLTVAQRYSIFLQYSSEEIKNYAHILNNQNATSFKENFNEQTVNSDADILRISNIFANKVTITNFKNELEYKVKEEPVFFKVTKSKLIPHNLTYNKIRFKNKDNTSILFIYFDKINPKTIYIEGYSTGTINRDSDSFNLKILDPTERIVKLNETIYINNSADLIYLGDISNISKNFNFGDILQLDCSNPSLVEIFDYPQKGIVSNLTGNSQKFIIDESELKEFIPPPVVIDKLPNAFVFKTFEDDEEMAKVEFNKPNMKLIVTSTGAIYNDGRNKVFNFELLDPSSSGGIKASSRIRGDEDATTFKDELDNAPFAYNDIVLLAYDDPTKLDLTNYPNKGDTYNMQHVGLEAFLITPRGIVQYVLPNNIILNNADNAPMFTMQFAIVNKSILVKSTGNNANSSGEGTYFKATLYSPDGITEKMSSSILSNEDANNFASDFEDSAFQYTNILKLEYKESNKVIITNFPDSSTPIYNPKGTEAWFKITESGLVSFMPK